MHRADSWQAELDRAWGALLVVGAAHEEIQHKLFFRMVVCWNVPDRPPRVVDRRGPTSSTGCDSWQPCCWSNATEGGQNPLGRTQVVLGSRQSAKASPWAHGCPQRSGDSPGSTSNLGHRIPSMPFHRPRGSIYSLGIVSHATAAAPVWRWRAGREKVLFRPWPSRQAPSGRHNPSPGRRSAPRFSQWRRPSPSRGLQPHLCWWLPWQLPEGLWRSHPGRRVRHPCRRQHVSGGRQRQTAPSGPCRHAHRSSSTGRYKASALRVWLGADGALYPGGASLGESRGAGVAVPSGSSCWAKDSSPKTAASDRGYSSVTSQTTPRRALGGYSLGSLVT